METMPATAVRGALAGSGEAPQEVHSPDERERLTDAATRTVAAWGYEAIDEGRIADSAGLSLGDFHRHFADKDQCLLAAYDRFLERLLEHVDEASESARDWPDRVKLTIESAFDFLVELETVARIFVVDARAGAAALDRRCSAIERAADWLKQGRRLFPATAEYPDAMEQTLVAGVMLMASVHLLAENADRLPKLEAEVVELVLTPYIGTSKARRVANS